MQVEILNEEGYEEALMGMSYSFKDRASDVEAWWAKQYDKATKRAGKLAPMDKGHNKFLRQIVLWVDIEAPRAFWSEFDTYKVGTVAQSESTMHTLAKRPPEVSDFEEGTHPAMIEAFKQVWRDYKHDITVLKENLPEGFLQRRLVTLNYQNLREILSQREGHRYKRWDTFCKAIREQVEHPELLCEESK